MKVLERRPSVEYREGPEGEPGPRGPKGDRGDQGPAGRDGKDGRNGIDGKPGRDGQDAPPQPLRMWNIQFKRRPSDNRTMRVEMTAEDGAFVLIIPDYTAEGFISSATAQGEAP